MNREAGFHCALCFYLSERHQIPQSYSLCKISCISVSVWYIIAIWKTNYLLCEHCQDDWTKIMPCNCAVFFFFFLKMTFWYHLKIWLIMFKMENMKWYYFWVFGVIEERIQCISWNCINSTIIFHLRRCIRAKQHLGHISILCGLGGRIPSVI